MLQRDARFYPSRECGRSIRQIWIRWTTGVSFNKGSTVRRSIMWRSWKNVCWASGGCWTTPSSHQQRLRSGVVVWMHVFAWMVDILNINFEPLTFCCVLFVSSILVPLNVIDINMRPCSSTTKCHVNLFVYNNVQSANIAWNVLILCLRLSRCMVAT